MARPGNQEPRSQTTPARARAIGRPPVWFGPYATVDLDTRTIRIDRKAPVTRHGWRIQVLWRLTATLRTPVTATVTTRAGKKAMIQLGGVYEMPPEPAVTLRADKPGAWSSAKTADFPSYVYFAKTACYLVRLRVGGNERTYGFGVGR